MESQKGNKFLAPSSSAISRSGFGHNLPRLKREFYQADAVVFWTLTIHEQKTAWLNERFHQSFRELMIHTAAWEGLVCPAYCLMPDHLHLVWMVLKASTVQRRAMKFFRTYIARSLKSVSFQHQAYDHVLTEKERTRARFNLACVEYVPLNHLKAGLVKNPKDWPYLGAIIPRYPDCNPFSSDFLALVLEEIRGYERGWS